MTFEIRDAAAIEEVAAGAPMPRRPARGIARRRASARSCPPVDTPTHQASRGCRRPPAGTAARSSPVGRHRSRSSGRPGTRRDARWCPSTPRSRSGFGLGDWPRTEYWAPSALANMLPNASLRGREVQYGSGNGRLKTTRPSRTALCNGPPRCPPSWLPFCTHCVPPPCVTLSTSQNHRGIPCARGFGAAAAPAAKTSSAATSAASAAPQRHLTMTAFISFPSIINSAQSRPAKTLRRVPVSMHRGNHWALSPDASSLQRLNRSAPASRSAAFHGLTKSS